MMKRTLRLTIYILLSLAVIVTIAAVVANSVIKSKIEKFIAEDLPENMIGSYSSLSLQLLNGAVEFTNPSLILKNKENNVSHTFINLRELRISGVSYWDYLTKDEIHIGKILIQTPEVTFYKDRKITIVDTVSEKISTIKKPIQVDSFELNNAQIFIFETGKDSTKLYAKDFSVMMREIRLNNATVKQKIPIKYESLEAKSDSIFLKANEYDNLTIADFSLENKNWIFNNVGYKTKYSREKLSRIIKVERDHYNLLLKSLSVNSVDFGFNDDQFYTKINEIIIDTPSLKIFRDKLVADDLSIKPLYSKSIRELPFQLTTDSIKIENGFLEYEEKVKQENDGGSISFNNLNATFLNVSNSYSSPEKTELKINALFMDKTPFSALWSFDVQNPHNDFIFKGNLGVIEADKMNAFTEPNLKVRLEGRVDRTYFTIDGNDDTSHTDMKINYSDFKISILQKEGEKKNKVLSAIVNIFISKDSKKKDEKYREASAEATRDKTKSIFNFIWISVKGALLKCVTGQTK